MTDISDEEILERAAELLGAPFDLTDKDDVWNICVAHAKRIKELESTASAHDLTDAELASGVEWTLKRPDAVWSSYVVEKREHERCERELRNCESRIREQRAEINRLATIANARQAAQTERPRIWSAEWCAATSAPAQPAVEVLPPLPKKRFIAGEAGRNSVRWGEGYDADDMRAYALAARATVSPEPGALGSAKHTFDAVMAECGEVGPIERLKFFCSIAMNSQDWLDVEPFFDALIETTAPQDQAAPHASNRPDQKWYRDKIMNTLDDDLLIGAKPPAQAAPKRDAERNSLSISFADASASRAAEVEAWEVHLNTLPTGAQVNIRQAAARDESETRKAHLAGYRAAITASTTTVPASNAATQPAVENELLWIAQRIRDDEWFNVPEMKRALAAIDLAIATRATNIPASSAMPVAWLFECKKPGHSETFASVDENETLHWPVDQWTSIVKTPLVKATSSSSDEQVEHDKVIEKNFFERVWPENPTPEMIEILRIGTRKETSLDKILTRYASLRLIALHEAITTK